MPLAVSLNYDVNNPTDTAGDNNKWYYYHYNAHGDVIGVTDKDGNIFRQYVYDPYGNIISVKDGSGAAVNISNDTGFNNAYTYRGYRFDSETGLYFLNTRYYAAGIGRFLTKDSFKGDARIPSTFNLYTYCGGDPVNRVDPTGRDWLDYVKAGATGAAYGAIDAFSIILLGPVGVDAVVSRWSARLVAKGAGKAVEYTGRIAKNTANLQKWAKNMGWEQKFTEGGVEMWGVRNSEGVFSWRLKLKPEASTRAGLEAGSSVPRFDARLDASGTYINPFTGQIGGKAVGTHIPLE